MFLIAGCHQSAHRANPTEFVWATRVSMSTLDPAAITEQITADGLRQVYECLATIDQQGRIQPGLAQSWSWSPDRRTITFRLRPGVRFSDHSILSSQDVAFSWTRALRPEIGGGLAQDNLRDVEGAQEFQNLHATSITGISAPNDLTVVVGLSRPSNSFVARISYPALAIVSRKSCPSDRVIKSVSEMVGTGPFLPVAYREDVSLDLVRRQDYWGGLPAISALQLLCVRDDQTRVALISKGQADLGYVAPSEVTGLERNPNLHITWLAQVGYLQMNSKTFPTLRDRRVRLALALATDRKRLVHQVLGDVFEEAQGVVPPSLASSRVGSLMPAYDPAWARQILADAGYPDGKGFPNVQIHVAKKGHPDPTAEAIATDWRSNLGISATVAEGSSKDLIEKSQRGDLAFYVTGWSGDYADLGNYIPMLFGSKSSQNMSGYRNAEVDRLIGRADRVSDQSQRVAILNRAEALVLKDMPVIPLYHRREPELTSGRFTGLSFSPFGHLSMAGVRPVR